MNTINDTAASVQEFIITGFPKLTDQESRKILFVVFLAVYFFILLGNILLIIIFISNRNLHTPMYVLICGLSILDIVITTNTLPSMLVVFSFGSRVAPFAACFLQTTFWLSLFSTESFLLTLMAYDRYIAICNPLQYPTIMSNSRVLKMIACCWVAGFLCSAPSVILALNFPFCGPNKVIHVFCDYSSVLVLACGNILITSFLGLSIGLSVLIFPLTFILFSYVRIMFSVIKIATSEGRLKAFYTCGTHFLVISVFFLVAGGVFISYRIPGTSVDMRIMGSIFQNVFPALMNPVIYCLRTKEIRDSLVKMLKKKRVLPNRKS
ncbi:olfactory receptor 6N2-like [Erpetoichthys calabaricus]|uniref:olfactory receptor 6N2-like n=1 Tax=Erpetoichthys calabaricus TaxID=27687 RepID=UPI0010A051CD|nr:olfactory receptor 6N2-like [Erpetoichthys calabaricus]